MKRRPAAAFGLACLLATAASNAEPPFYGTIFIDPDIIRASDPTAFVDLAYSGQATRSMFDRRANAFVQYQAYLFDADYDDGLRIEIQVNPEFGSVDAAQAQAAYYAPVIGRLPRALRQDVETTWIHQGDEAFGGGNNNLLIHTGSIAQGYIADGILEETLAHEAAHTSLDALHAASAGWLSAQQADPEYISSYARDNPTREDIAETVVPWLAVRHVRWRIDEDVAVAIETSVPNRLAYLDGLALALYPFPGDSADVVFVDGFEPR